MAWAEDTRIPVVVELFTSEGCASCPPADEALLQLERSQPVSKARVIALEEHVDYWNPQGWKDRFSSPAFSVRQSEYARVFHSDSIYTPQMVVEGQAGFVGDDVDTATSEIGKAAANQAYSLRLQPAPAPGNASVTELSIYVKHERPGKPAPADVYLAITESRLSSEVRAGENAGRRVRHSPVVRSFGVIGSIDSRPFEQVGLKSTLKFPEEWKRENLRAVVFVQDRSTRRITGAQVVDLR